MDKFHKYPNIDPLTDKKIIIGDKRYLELVVQYGEPSKIISPITQRKICINKLEYKKLIKSGYTDEQLLYPKLTPKVTECEMVDMTDTKDIDTIINQMSKMSITEDNVFFGHLSTFILKDKLYCFGKSLQSPSVITCCPTMFNLYIYTFEGLFILHPSGIRKIEFNHAIQTMKYSFGYLFILTTKNELYVYHDYTQEFTSNQIKNVKLISTCSVHALLLIDNRVYIIPHDLYSDITLENVKSYKIKNVVKLSASKRGDLILSDKLYGIKENDLWRLNVDDVIDISSSDYHDMVLTKKGLIGFGENSSGQLGQGNKHKYEGLVNIDIPKGTTRVYCGIHNTIVYNGDYYGFGDHASMGFTSECLTPQLIKID